MPPEISQEQSQQIASWVDQRDAILLDLASKKEENFKLTEANKNLVQSHSEMQREITVGEGRIQEIRKIEKERETVISKELSELLIQKSQLQSEITGLVKETNLLIEKRDEVIKSTEVLSDICEKTTLFIELSKGTFQDFSNMNQHNVREVEMLLEKMKDEFKKIIDINEKNCEKAEKVMVDMPKIVFSLQRDILERKHLNKIKKS